MMTEMEAGFRKMRVWIGELPDVGCQANTRVYHKTIEAHGPWTGQVDRAAIEVFIPTGGMALYGLLGGAFLPGPEDCTTIEVVTYETPCPAPDWSLAARVDDLRSGLPPGGYVQYIWEGALGAASGIDLGSGVLRFDQALLGGMGSGPIVFRWLARSLVHLVGSRESVETSDDVAAMIHPSRIALARW